MDSVPSFAVIVATRNRGAKIAGLLNSIVGSVTTDFEAVIVDQSTNQDTYRTIEPFLSDARIRYVHSELPGTSRARNRGIALTRAPLIAITDDDCIVPPDWLSALTQPFLDDPRIGVVFGNVDAVPVNEPGHTPTIHFNSSRTVSELRMVWSSPHLSLGASMAIRRAILEDVGGFDEHLGPGATFQAAEDNDLAWRALIAGWRIRENAEVSVLHDGFRTLDELRELVKRDFYGVGGTIAKYIKGGYWRVNILLFSCLVEFGIVEPFTAILMRRFPRGLRRPYMLLRGLRDGLKTPMDKRSLCYRPAIH
ncbi:MAG: glycosyltransferase family 2 protein [Hyphomicrobiaceae bacterium]